MLLNDKNNHKKVSFLLAARFFCVEVTEDTGMIPAWVDDFAEDNFMCQDLKVGNVKTDCGKGMSVSKWI